MTAPRKILLVSDNFPPLSNGVSRVGEMFCACIDPDNLLVIAPNWEGDTAFDASVNYPVRRARMRSSKAPGLARKLDTAMGIVRGFFAMRRAVREFKPDLIVFTSVVPIGVHGPWFKKHYGVPFAILAHGLEIWSSRPYFMERLRSRSLGEASVIMCNSAFTRDSILKPLGLPDDRLTVLHPRIDATRFEDTSGIAEFKKREGLEGKLVFLTVAVLQENKGVQQVLRALPQCIDQHPDLVYVVVGEGDYRQSLEAMARDLGIEDNVRFVGNRDVTAFFHACDVYIMTTLFEPDRGHFETFGITFLEANACGKPVIGGTGGGMPESIADGESGLLVDTSDVASVRGAILKLAGDAALRERLGDQGRKRVHASFTIDSLRAEIAEILRNL